MIRSLSPILLFCYAVLLTCFCTRAPAIAQSTQPAAAPVDELLLQLGSPSPSLRSAARLQLMQLPNNQLPALRDAIVRAGALSPAQSQALPDIVIQAYLSGLPYPTAGESGFLGIVFPPSLSDGEDLVMVAGRFPGFCAYAVLCDGDILLALSGRYRQPIRSTREFIDTVRALQSGSVLQLQILRHGRLVDVTLTLSARPWAANNSGVEAMTEFNAERMKKAQEYYQKNFANLTHGPVS